MNEVVIQGGYVVDGTGSPRRRADVAINGGRITAIGEDVGEGTKTIDATGKIVSPGFVDPHTHYDVMGFWDTSLSPSPLHGVTSAIAGNCGFSVAPLSEESADYLMRMLARVEAMPLSALEEGVPWNWRTTGEYLDQLDGTLAINTAFMVGHSPIRRMVMGPAATEREATEDEVRQMAELLRDGLRAGGLGFSSTWSPAHSDAEGKPVPSRWAAASELVELAAVCKEFEGTSLEFLAGQNPWSDETKQLMVDMTVTAQRPLNWNVVVANAATMPHWEEKLNVGDRAREAGGKVIGLVLPQDFGAQFNFMTAFVLDDIDGWGPAMTMPPEERIALLKDPAERAKLAELAANDVKYASFTDWAATEIVEVSKADLKHYEGRVVADIAAEEGKSAFDALLDIVVADDLHTSFRNARTAANSQEDWEARRSVWTDNRAVVGGSDAGAHLDMLGSFILTTQFLESAVRESGMLSVEEAIRLITSVPADLFGLIDRGRLEVDACADIVIFDEDTVGPQKVGTRYDLPGGAARLYAGSVGIDYVLVNGEVIVADGAMTEARPGVILRSGVHTRTPSLAY